jgi:uncharacterized membrane protein
MPSDFDLLRPLDTEPRSPSTVDVRPAISTARRKQVFRNAGYAGAATLTAAAAVVGGVLINSPGTSTPTQPAATKAAITAAAAKAPETCTVEQLSAPGGAPSALIFGADPAGKYFVGSDRPVVGGKQGAIWHDGVATEVPLPGNSDKLLTDVNASGTAVGWSYATASTPVPYVYSGGKVSQLPGVQNGQALAINSRGQIVGVAADEPVLWKSATAEPTPLPLPAGAESGQASDIDEDGTVIGTVDNKVPYVWLPNGTHHALKLPDLDGKPAEGRATHIRDGWVTGNANDAGGGKAAGLKTKTEGKSKVVRWNLRSGQVQIVDAIDKMADAINAQGWQTGIAKQGGATLYAGNTEVVLPGLAPNPQDHYAHIANTLSDDGRTVAGQSNDANGVIQAVVWHCK